MPTTTLILRDVREAKGFTQEELAAAVGTTQRTISRLESGVKLRADLDLLVKICVALDVTMSDLVPIPKRRR